MKTYIFTLTVTVVFAACAQASLITLSTLEDNSLVGWSDTNSNNPPAAPGDGWFTGTYSGTVRERATTNFPLRTQWYFRFDDTALATIIAGKITSATLKLPQIGRLNTGQDDLDLVVYDTDLTWDSNATPYPTWNAGA